MHLADILSEPTFASRRSPITLRNYAHQVKTLAARGIVHLEDVTEESVRRFVDARLAEIQPQSVRQTLHPLFAILAHLERSDRYAHDSLRRLYRLKPHVKAPPMLSAPHLSRDEVEQLARAAAHLPLTALTVQIGWLAGLRLGELAARFGGPTSTSRPG